MTRFALVDCNNFYASCERVFNPSLMKKPVIVLSNNDGCVIARSNESKVLGIKMGQPFFEVKHLCRQRNVTVFSSNYSLYGDMSNRVMHLLEESWPEVEVYSIDEAFLDLTSLTQIEVASFCSHLYQKILQYTGLPVSIGIGKTKTLAKFANGIAKKDLKSPYFDVTDALHWLYCKPVDEVWGVGKRWSQKLMQQGIETAGQLKDASPHVIRRQFSITLEQVVLELGGINCISINNLDNKKSITSSRSFAVPALSFEALMRALSSFCDVASTKLRRQKAFCGQVSVFLRTNGFRKEDKQYHASLGMKLIYPSNDVREITRVARTLLLRVFKEGYAYKKIGVYLDELTSGGLQQLDIWQAEVIWST
jgi:DNA polymerase V